MKFQTQTDKLNLRRLVGAIRITALLTYNTDPLDSLHIEL